MFTYREGADPWEVVDPIWKKWTQWGQRSTTWWMVSKLFHQQPGTFLLVTSLWRWTTTFEERLSQLHSATRPSPFSSIPGWILVLYLIEWKNHRLFSLIHPPEKCWGDLASESGSHEKLEISATHYVTWCWIMEGVEPCKEGCNVLQLYKVTII